MKKIAIFLLIYLSIASAMPAIGQLGTGCDSVCTSEDLPAGQKEKNGSDNNNHCPFATCCCTICVACYPQEEKIKFSSVQTGTEKPTVESENPTSTYINECWHPPEVV
jgi:hypothetical protein